MKSHVVREALLVIDAAQGICRDHEDVSDVVCEEND